jgi:hypothetical protein
MARDESIYCGQILGDEESAALLFYWSSALHEVPMEGLVPVGFPF